MHAGDIKEIRRLSPGKHTQLLSQSRHHHGIRFVFRVLYTNFLLLIASGNDNHKRTGMLCLRLHPHLG